MFSGFQNGADKDLNFHFNIYDDRFSHKYEYQVSNLRPSFMFYLHGIMFSEIFRL